MFKLTNVDLKNLLDDFNRLSFVRQVVTVDANQSNPFIPANPNRVCLMVPANEAVDLWIAPGNIAAEFIDWHLDISQNSLLLLSVWLHGDLVRCPWSAFAVGSGGSVVYYESSLIRESWEGQRGVMPQHHRPGTQPG